MRDVAPPRPGLMEVRDAYPQHPALHTGQRWRWR